MSYRSRSHRSSRSQSPKRRYRDQNYTHKESKYLLIRFSYLIAGTNIFVTNLSKNATLRDIERVYEKYGRVLKSKLVKD